MIQPSWSEPTTDESNASVILVSSLGIIAMVIVGVLLFLRRENYDGEIDDKYVEDEVVPLQGHRQQHLLARQPQQNIQLIQC